MIPRCWMTNWAAALDCPPLGSRQCSIIAVPPEFGERFKTGDAELSHWLTAGFDKGGSLVDADRIPADPLTCTHRFNRLFWLELHIPRSLPSSRQMQVSFPALDRHCICNSMTRQACSTSSHKRTRRAMRGRVNLRQQCCKRPWLRLPMEVRVRFDAAISSRCGPRLSAHVGWFGATSNPHPAAG